MVALAAATGLQAQALRVTTESGVLVGSAEAGTVVFRGVPYASAPVGSLRWAQPQPAKAWASERPATAYGANCPQKLGADGSPNSGGALGPKRSQPRSSTSFPALSLLPNAFHAAFETGE